MNNSAVPYFKRLLIFIKLFVCSFPLKKKKTKTKKNKKKTEVMSQQHKSHYVTSESLIDKKQNKQKTTQVTSRLNRIWKHVVERTGKADTRKADFRAVDKSWKTTFWSIL